MWKFKIQWQGKSEATNLFIGAGFLFSKEIVGFCISNLFIGWEID